MFINYAILYTGRRMQQIKVKGYNIVYEHKIIRFDDSGFDLIVKMNVKDIMKRY
jgi:hypothetical protein